MSKVYSNEIFSLIQSLNKHEKRCFKLYTKNKGVSENFLYLKLFDTIEKQKTYNEDELVKKIPGLTNNKLHKTKYALQELVLESLRHYQTNTIDTQLRQIIQTIEILLEKGLLKLCQKKIERGKTIALEHEKFLFYTELLFLEYELIRAQSYLGKDENNMHALFEELFISLNKYKNLAKHVQLLSVIQAHTYSKGSAREGEDVSFYKTILLAPELQNESSTLSVRALYFFYFSKIVCYSRLNEPEKVRPYLLKISSLIENPETRITQKTYTHIGILNNLANNQLALKKYNEIPVTLQKMRAISLTSPLQGRLVFYLSNLIELIYCNTTGQFDNGLKLIAKIKGFDYNLLDKQQAANMYYYFACIYFGAQKYKEANKYLQKVLAEVTNFRADLQSFARIFQMILYYETGKMDLMEYSVKSAYRYLYKNKRLYKTETVLLNFLRRELPKMNTQPEIIAGFKLLRKQLLEVHTNHYEQSVLSFFDLLSWLNSKIENISFEQAIVKAININKSNAY